MNFEHSGAYSEHLDLYFRKYIHIYVYPYITRHMFMYVQQLSLFMCMYIYKYIYMIPCKFLRSIRQGYSELAFCRLGWARLGWLGGGGLRRASRLIDKLAGRLTGRWWAKRLADERTWVRQCIGNDPWSSFALFFDLASGNSHRRDARIRALGCPSTPLSHPSTGCTAADYVRT